MAFSSETYAILQPKVKKLQQYAVTGLKYISSISSLTQSPTSTNKGDLYISNVEGTLNNFNNISVKQGDGLVYNGSGWDKIAYSELIKLQESFIIKDKYSDLTTPTKSMMAYVNNDEKISGVDYSKGFYVYDKTTTTPKWEKISVGSDGDGGCSLSKDIVTNVDVGNVPAGTTLKKDMTFTEYVERVHVKEIAPSFTFTCSNSPSTNKAKYETVITNTVLTCTINNFNTAKDCTLIEFIDNSGTVIHSEPYVAGTNTYTFTDTTNIIKDNFTYKCNLHYKKSDGSAGTITQSVSFKFVAYGYYGISSVTAFSTLADLKALSGQNTSGSKNLAWNGINCTFQNMIYAYPASYGALSKVMYAGFDYVTSFTQTTQNITMPDGTVQAFFIYSLNTNINNATFVFS